ncbi:HlyD family secretion protein [Acinetobacter sp. neg1]|uniref:HlyD family efflux transporter periplasmic adaptor subunit n=1 Tax=Acinetobacter sp. neg1 TaxID=1561068 RepID=UPI0005442275|nr:HlyD family efflux transporter periplasmic adaptor subunit [Acinetobacter sp. neg1]KHF78791.1 HlyD family secretion protein [Acinetobacter sp. neg1]
MSEQLQESTRSMNTSHNEPPLPHASLVIGIVGASLLIFLIWAWLFKLEEVSTGIGKVIPSSKEQVIQSLEGGILTKLNVQEGDIVQKGQILALLDSTRFASSVGEAKSVLIAAQTTAARLRAEVNDMPLVFSKNVAQDTKLIADETALYNSRRANLQQTLSGLKQALELVSQELAMTEPLVAKGAASEVEVLRLRRESNDLQNKINDARNQYYVKAREELSKANTNIQTQEQIIMGRNDSLERAVLKAPVRGVVKEITVTTLGGVIPQNGKLMTIVPIDEQLLIEARILPRDIAFIHPRQEALVKLTAYDYSIYGGLKGKVTVISPDTIRDEVKQDQFYYRVYIRTESDKIYNKEGKIFSITPGMVATVDIRTGEKSIIDYLLKPFNKAKEALRER